jgi:hypothetical protein
LNAKLATESVQTRSVLNVIKDGIGELSRQLKELSAQSGQLAMLADQPDPPTEDAAAAVEANGNAFPEDSLPELPPNTNARKIVEEFDAEAFFANPSFNPDGKELNRSEWLQVENLITKARTRLTTLQSDIHLLVGEKMESMYANGLFVDYEKGQKRITQRGVYTSGEPLGDGAMRIYSFPPEENPKLYEMREEMRRIPKETIRRLMALARKK